jgi:hypothetical protein
VSGQFLARGQRCIFLLGACLAHRATAQGMTVLDMTVVDTKESFRWVSTS